MNSVITLKTTQDDQGNYINYRHLKCLNDIKIPLVSPDKGQTVNNLVSSYSGVSLI